MLKTGYNRNETYIIELLYKICVMRENFCRTRIARMNTEKKETEICGIRVNPCPKDWLRPEAAL